MNGIQITHKQHYVFQAYLKHWVVDNQIWCKRNNKIFKTNTLNVAQEKDFYRIKEINEDEKQFILRVFGRNAETAEILQKQLDLYENPFQWKMHVELVKLISENYVYNGRQIPNDVMELLGEAERFVDACTNDLIEDTYSDEEGKMTTYLNRLMVGDLNFYYHPSHDEDSAYDDTKREFLAYFCTQYFRTKAIRTRLINAVNVSLIDTPHGIGFDKANVRPEHIVFHIAWFASCQLADMLYDRNAHLTLLRNNTDRHFVTTDQPIINLLADYRNHIDNIDDTILYYPLSPTLAITINDRNDETLIDVSADNVDELNRKLIAASLEFVFADSSTLLERYRA